MKVLITGGMGVIGAETSRRFVKKGHRPVVFARHRDDSLIGDIADKIDFEQGDVLDMPRILQAIKKHRVTHVVHAAAFVGAVSAGNPALSIQVNVMGLVNVLEAARALGVEVPVTSPTYTIGHRYDGVSHLDLYRLERLTEADWQRAGTHSELGRYSTETWLRFNAAHAHDHAAQVRENRAAWARRAR
jgi:nucleoside-diphosphate-sugar epimerase